MSEDALREAADRLYRAPRDAFVRERTALVRTAREQGDRDLAARIGALAKPSAAAALVNDLVREQPDDLRRLLDLGADLRRAQEESDRTALQRLTAERRTLVPRIVERAADRAGEHAARPGPAALEEAGQTLLAALGSEEAADAVRSGRLLRGLTADGLEDVDLRGAVAAPGGLQPLPERPPRAALDPDEQRIRKERDRARASADAARRRATGLRREAEDAEHRAAAAEEDATAADADVAARRAALRQTEDTAARAHEVASAARRAAVDAERAAARAEAEAEAARAAPA